jgi:hypothetical protein
VSVSVHLFGKGALAYVSSDLRIPEPSHCAEQRAAVRHAQSGQPASRTSDLRILPGRPGWSLHYDEPMRTCLS